MVGLAAAAAAEEMLAAAGREGEEEVEEEEEEEEGEERGGRKCAVLKMVAIWKMRFSGGRMYRAKWRERNDRFAGRVGGGGGVLLVAVMGVVRRGGFVGVVRLVSGGVTTAVTEGGEKEEGS